MIGGQYQNCIDGTTSEQCKSNLPHERQQCQKCPSGFSTNSIDGAAACEECEEGKYSDADTTAGTCLSCPTGYVSSLVEGTDSKGAIVPDSKTYSACIAIDQKKFRPDPMLTKTKYCLAGHYCDGMNMLPCPPGRSALSEQELGCVECDRGKFSTTGEICGDCPPAFYAEGRGASTCQKCPPDTFRELPGATSSSDCYGKNKRVVLKSQYIRPYCKTCVHCW